jgi:hypothetical protein
VAALTAPAACAATPGFLNISTGISCHRPMVQCQAVGDPPAAVVPCHQEAVAQLRITEASWPWRANRAVRFVPGALSRAVASQIRDDEGAAPAPAPFCASDVCG